MEPEQSSGLEVPASPPTPTPTSLDPPAAIGGGPIWPARVSLLGTSDFVILVAALHGIQCDLDPTARPISDYVFGRAGWLVTIALVAVGLGALDLAAAMRPRLRAPRPRAALLLLVVFGVAMVAAGIFPTLPLSADGEDYQPTLTGIIHIIAAGLGFTSLAMAAPLLTRRLAVPGRRLAIASRSMAAAVPIGYLCFCATAVLQPLLVDLFGWASILGVGQRIMVAACMAWLAVAALAVSRDPNAAWL